MKEPLSTQYFDPIGGTKEKLDMELLQETILDGYNALNNWFRVDLSSDLEHIIYCARLYAITGHILRGHSLSMTDFEPEHLEILKEWIHRVDYHVEQIKTKPKESEAWFREAQYLHDLMWSCLDDIHAPECCQECLFSFCAAMEQVNFASYKTDRSLMSIKDSEQYMLVQLGHVDDIYLIPDKVLYPVINAGSVKLAVDSIEEVLKEYPEDVQTYVSNLNRKYKEFGCTFSISTDHPFAPYAEKDMIDNMTCILTESNTAVNDTEGAAELNSPNNQTDQPWYKRLDYIGALYRMDRKIKSSDRIQSHNKSLTIPCTQVCSKKVGVRYESYLDFHRSASVEQRS